MCVLFVELEIYLDRAGKTGVNIKFLIKFWIKAMSETVAEIATLHGRAGPGHVLIDPGT